MSESLRQEWQESTRAEKLLLVMLACTAALHFIFAFALPVRGFDANVHLDWLAEFSELWRGGVWYPRWLPHEFGGLGAGTFYLYPPLLAFFGALLRGLVPNIDAIRQFQVLQVLISISAVATCLLYLRSYKISRLAALAASLLFGFSSPGFHAIFMASSLGQHLSFVWVPLIFWSIDISLRGTRQHRATNLRCFVFSSLSWALLVLTNVPASIIMSLVVPFYYFAHRKNWRSFWPSIIGAIFAVLLAAAFTLPIAQFSPLFQTDQLFKHSVAPLVKWDNQLEGLVRSDVPKSISIEIGVWMFVLSSFICFLLYKLRSKLSEQFDRDAAAAWVFVGCVLLFFQIPRISTPFWKYIPLVKYLQFTWRFTLLLPLVSAVLYALLSKASVVESRRLRKQTIGVILILAALSFGCYLRYGYIVILWPPPPPAVEEARIGAGEHLPITAPDFLEAKAYARLHLQDPFVLGPDSIRQQIMLTRSEPNRRSLSVALATTSNVTLHQFYWPMWKLYCGTEEIPTYADSLGLVNANLPAGEYTLDYRLEKGWSEIWGARISGVALLIWLIAASISFVQMRREPKNV